MTAHDYKEKIDQALDAYFHAEEFPFRGLADSMRYSLLAGGKRIRPMLVLEFCRICGGDMDAALPVACAVEMLHTYSLIHDDLPCMDNDDLRRGRPTNHVVYGECTATLAGDCLQAEAFGTILRSGLPAKARADCAEILAGAAGLDGICGGQYLDMIWEGQDLDEEKLSEIDHRKTGSLLVAACQMGVAAAGGDESAMDAAGRFAAAIGLAFQIRDDMLDVISTADELGKPIGSDREEKKNTYMAVYGQEKCEDMVRKLTECGKAALRERFEDVQFLCDLADSMVSRRN